MNTSRPTRGFELLADGLLPLALFGMLGSLLWFLLDVRAALVEGPTERLRWVFFFFMLAVVGINRIQVRDGSQQAGVFALALVLAMGVFGYCYSYGGGSMGGGYGGARPGLSLAFNYLLIALVWAGSHYLVSHTAVDPETVNVQEAGLLSAEEWSDQGLRASAVRRRHHPGRAVMLLSALAILLFGVGQRTLAGSQAAQRHAFWCMVVYLACALATLAMTALVGLQLYVRQRGARLPAALPAVWLLLAAPLAAGVLVFAQVTPRLQPRPGTWAPRVVFAGDRDGTTLSHGPVEGDGQARSSSARTQRQSQRRTPADRGPQARGEGGRQSGGDPGQTGQAGQGPGGQSPGAQGSPGGQSGGGSRGQGEGQTQGEQSQPSAQMGQQGTPNAAQQVPLAPSAASAAGRLVGLLILLVGGVLALWWGVRWLAQRLRSRGAPSTTASGASTAAPTRNPFEDPFGPRSPLRGRPPADVVRHVYRAFQAYCALAGCPRRPDLTAREFLHELPPSQAGWRAEIEGLTGLYEAAEYTPDSVDESCLPLLRAFWGQLIAAVEKVRS